MGKNNGLRTYVLLWLPATLLCTVVPACTASGESSAAFAGQAEALALTGDSNSILWSIGGSVTNSNPNAWVAVRNGNDVEYVYGANRFTLRTPYVNNTSYNVIIAGSDPALQCTIANNTGTISRGPVTNVAVTCLPPTVAQFINGFEIFDRALDWSNTADTSWGAGGVDHVTGYCCGMTGPQAMATSNESAHTGTGALVFSGWAAGNSNTQAAYLETFDLSTLSLAGGVYLSYWIYPQSQRSFFGDAVTGKQSAYSAVDITLSDGTAVHFRPGLFDQFGNKPAPASQGNLVLDSWNYVQVDLGSVALDQLETLSVGWQNAQVAGGYRGYLDDVIIDYAPPPAATGMFTSWENFQTLPTWINTVDTNTTGGGAFHVGGLCCGASGPQVYVSSELAYTGSRSLVYAGAGSGFAPNYAYMKVLDLSHSNIVLDGLSTLSYKVYPQSAATFGAAAGDNSANVAVDVIFADGDALRFSGLLDNNGNGVTPSEQSAGLFLDQWNQVTIDLGSLAGKVPVRLDVGWNGNYQGGYRGFIDDLTLGDMQPAIPGQKPSLVRIVLAPAHSFLMVAGIQLAATAIYSDGTQKVLNGNVTYTSDNTAVATVDASGLVTTHAVGTARIKATFGTVDSSAYVVTVNPPGHTLGGTVSGLFGATKVNVIQGRDHIFVGNGGFTYPTPVADGSTYNATLVSPTGQICGFTGGTNTGTMPAADTSPITVSCSPNSFSLGGVVSGLLSATHVTLVHGADTLTPTNGSYTFPTLVPYQTAYTITITQPAGQTCAFAPSGAGSGTMGGAAVTNANVACNANAYALGGNVTGLSSGNVTLTNTNNTDSISVGNGTFVFDHNVNYATNFNVVAAPPAGQVCHVTNGNGVMPVGGDWNIIVTCLPVNFTIQYYFTQATSPNYTFDAAKLAISQNVVSLKPLFTSVGDNSGTSFAGGTSLNTAYDAGGYLRLNNPGVSMPTLFYTGLDALDPQLGWFNTIDTANDGTTNVVGHCCGLSGPETKYSTEQGLQSPASVLYSGYGNGGSTTRAVTKAFSLAADNFVIDGHSVLSYYVFPNSSSTSSSSGNNSTYVSLDLVFTDATNTRSAGLTDVNGNPFTPMGQGAGGQLALDQWNLVSVDLSSLAGKTVDRIDIAWQKDGATGGFRGYVGNILLTGSTTSHFPAAATLSADWAPMWSNLIGYWPMQGTGSLANGTSIPGVVGPSMTASSNNGSGMSYANGMVGTGLFLDGTDDNTQVNINTTSTSFTYSYWIKLLGYFGGNPYCSFIVALGNGNGDRIWDNPHCGGDMTYYLDNNASMQVYAGYQAVLNTGTWVHAVTVGDTDGIKLYRDGILVGSVSTSGGSGPLSFNSFALASYSPPLAIMDEVALWNVPLTASQVFTLHQRQSAAFAGSFTSAVSASPFAGNTASGMSWSTLLPHSKDIPPGSIASESSTTYPSVGASTLNSNLAILWHLDETASGTVAGSGADFNDFSGNGDFGQTTNGSLTFGTRCLFANCPFFTNGPYITSTNPYSPAPQTLTISVWFRLLTNSQGGALVFMSSGGYQDRSMYVGSDNMLNFWVNDGAVEVLAGTSVVTTRRWHHAVATLSSAGAQLYQDGVLVASNSGVTSAQVYSGALWNVGANVNYGGQTNTPPQNLYGSLDEFAFWTRALSATEIQQLYRRGANRLQLQTRQCTSSLCADNPSWQGPDGTNQTYFSELDDGTSGLVPGISPLNTYLTAAPVLTVDVTKPYVQYRAFLQSDDVNNQCSYGGAAPCSPEVTAAELYRVNYSTAKPAVTLTGGAASYVSLTSFAQAIGTAGCTGGITYTLSPDHVTNYYYTGAAWAAANGSALQSTAAAALTAPVMGGFAGATTTPGQAYFQAFLASDGNTPCALQSVSLGATRQ